MPSLAPSEPSTNGTEALEDLEELFAHLTPAVLSTILKWHGRFSNEEVGQTLERVVDRMAQEQPTAVGVALGSSERVVVTEALRLVKERALEGVGDQWQAW